MALIKIEKHHSSTTTPVLVYKTQTDQLRIREICCFPIYVHMHIHTKTNKDFKKLKLPTTTIKTQKTQQNKAKTKTSTARKSKPQQNNKSRSEKTQHSSEQHLQNMQVLLSNTYFENYKFK